MNILKTNMPALTIKKPVLVFSLFLLSISATSCKKYDCTCDTYGYDSNGNYVLQSSSQSSTSAPTMIGAENKCSQKSSGYIECH